MPGSLPQLVLEVWRFSWSVFWCAESSQEWGVVFNFVQVRLSEVKKIPWYCNNLELELVGWRLAIKRHETLISKKSCFSLSENLFINLSLYYWAHCIKKLLQLEIYISICMFLYSYVYINLSSCLSPQWFFGIHAL